MISKPDWRTRFAAIIDRVNLDGDDVLAILGLALVAYGAGLIYRPAAFIVVGVAFLASSILGARRR